MKKRNIKALGRCGLSLLLALVMCLGLMNLSVFAADPAAATQEKQQITKPGGTNTGEGGVEVSKYISPTGKENYFDIELTVKTQSSLEELIKEQDIAAVTAAL